MTTHRIDAAFAALKQQGKKALIPFITAGDPSPELTVPLMHSLARAGADIIELGIPFSDPMADGPVIQRASERALAKGVSLRQVLSWVAQFRAEGGTAPVVLMGYANPIEAMGWSSFAQAAQAAGVDGVLTVDYPPEEAAQFASLLRTHGMDAIYLLAPTSTAARIEAVARQASGYIYYVSLKGITGSGALDVGAVAAQLPAIQAKTPLPVGVGFGIRDADTAAKIAQFADAVVIGSKLIQLLETAPANTPAQACAVIEAFISEVRRAMDAATQGANTAKND